MKMMKQTSAVLQLTAAFTLLFTIGCNDDTVKDSDGDAGTPTDTKSQLEATDTGGMSSSDSTPSSGSDTFLSSDTSESTGSVSQSTDTTVASQSDSDTPIIPTETAPDTETATASPTETEIETETVTSMDMDAGTDDAGSTTDDISCTQCENANCNEWHDACFNSAFAPECRAIIQCVRENSCAGTNVIDCFCGDGVTESQCSGMGPQGPCAEIFTSAGSEGTGSIEIISEISNGAAIDTPIGAAVGLINCDADHCPECLTSIEDIPEVDTDIATDTALVTATDTAVPSDTDAWDAGIVDAGACAVCELESCTNYGYNNENLWRACYEGSTAGECADFVACAYENDCALDYETCYCGTADPFSDCMTGSANGPCMAETEAAAQTSDALEIAYRYADPVYALGNAVSLLICDRTECLDECINP